MEPTTERLLSRRDFVTRAVPTLAAAGARSGRIAAAPSTPAAVPAPGAAKTAFDLKAVQAGVQEAGFDGWLLYDFRGDNALARRVLGVGECGAIITRRFFYFVPAEGEPVQLVHRSEPTVLDHLPGSKKVNLRWQELEAAVKELVRGCKKVAMEYSPATPTLTSRASMRGLWNWSAPRA